MGGRRRFRGGPRGQDGPRGQGGAARDDGAGRAWAAIVPENELFVKYYKTVVPEHEWDQFMGTLKETLPHTFRITGSRGEAEALRDHIQQRYFSKMNTNEAPKPLPWFPNQLGWSFNFSRKEAKRMASFKEFNQFLVLETELGNISRQEAVLDMCAAPGSKTAQLIEAVHGDSLVKGNSFPTGMVIANDADMKRCYVLVHQTQRLLSPCTIITNLDATQFPTVRLEPEAGSSVRLPLQFDRVLCDVPCSSDGTLRKNLLVWKKWSPMLSINLHNVQFRILKRGCELLKVGGRIIYSTCSFNPVENEAIVTSMLQHANGALELVDVNHILPDLKRRPGMHQWKVMASSGEIYNTIDEATNDADKQCLKPSMFPPAPDVATAFHLERCLRLFPHLQDSGGFFIAVFEKKAPYGPVDALVEKIRAREAVPTMTSTTNDSMEADPTEAAPEMQLASSELTDETALALAMDLEGATATSADGKPSKTADKFNKPLFTDPFVFMTPESPEIQAIRTFYEMDPSFPSDMLLVRGESGKSKQIYMVSSAVKQVLTCPDNKKMRIIQTGTRVLCKNNENSSSSPYRVMQDGLPYVQGFIRGLRIAVPAKDMITMLKTHQPHNTILTNETQQAITALLQQHGFGLAMFFVYDPATDPESSRYFISAPLVFSGWLGKRTAQVLVNKQQRESVLGRFGEVLGDYKTSSSKPNPAKRPRIDDGASSSSSTAVGDAATASASAPGKEPTATMETTTSGPADADDADPMQDEVVGIEDNADDDDDDDNSDEAAE